MFIALSVILNQERMERQEMESVLKEREDKIQALEEAIAQHQQELANQKNNLGASSGEQLNDKFQLADVQILEQKLQFTEKENSSIKAQFVEAQAKIQKLTG